MSGDVGDLFDRAARAMRPEFRAHLVDLYEQSSADRSSGPHVTRLVADPPNAGSAAGGDGPDGSAPTDWLVETAPRELHPRRPRGPAVWLTVAAAAVALVVGLATLDRRESFTGGRTNESGPAHLGPAGIPDCSSSEELATISVGAADLRIGLADDGRTFCVGVGAAPDADRTGDIIVGLGSADGEPAEVLSEPELLESGPGPALTNTHWYLFAIPDSVPVTDVLGATATTQFFTSRVDRRLLIIDVDVRASGADVAHAWSMFSAGGSYLGDHTAVGPATGPTDDTSTSGP